ncbi:MAG TPA: ankyrin repeat domain-containing protein, partial [Gammaproteobacteria bacterium]|nr:ankyrin repeat domain-containing protein [Gammaproteobacteria bacterium]
MRIQLKSPLHISVPELGKYIPNSRSSANSIYDKTNFHSILMMSEKVEGGYTEIDTYLEFEEFAKIINQIPLSLTKDLILALGKAGYELPKLYQVALEKNEVEIVERLLEKKADPNEKHNFHPTFFIDAIYRKREKLTLLLLKHKADIHQLTSSPYSLTPLMIAAWTDQPEIVRALLEEKSDPGLVGEKGHTALYMAVQSRSLDLVKTILGKKIDSNQPVGDESPLCLAVRNNDIEIVKTLVSHQADIELASGKYTPLILALLHENPKIAEYLIEKKANCTDPKVIIYASDNANADLIEKILAEKADINARSQDEAGMTALMYAASKGGVNIVKKLLEKNANLLAETKLEKKTALHFAVEEGYSQVVAELIEKKSNINAECKVGRALQLAMQKNQPAIVEMLLKAGADTNIK